MQNKQQIIFVWLTLSGRSYYPKWMAVFNPLVLILVSFSIFVIAPSIGVYFMPIALNIAFAILFAISIYFSYKLKNEEK